jgi:hypothetical protein
MSNAFKLVGFKGLSSVFHFVDFIVLLLSAESSLHILEFVRTVWLYQHRWRLLPLLEHHWCSTSFMVILMFGCREVWIAAAIGQKKYMIF